MTKREEYHISFQKKTISAIYIYPFATSTNSENSEIAGHISDSVESSTRSQIGSLQDAIDGKRIQEDWGEVQDFKQLLEEWLQFITT